MFILSALRKILKESSSNRQASSSNPYRYSSSAYNRSIQESKRAYNSISSYGSYSSGVRSRSKSNSGSNSDSYESYRDREERLREERDLEYDLAELKLDAKLGVAKIRETGSARKSAQDFRMDIFKKRMDQINKRELKEIEYRQKIDLDYLDDVQLREKEQRKSARGAEDRFRKLKTREVTNELFKHKESVTERLRKVEEEFLNGGDEELAGEIRKLLDQKNRSLEDSQKFVDAMGKENLDARRGKAQFDELVRKRAQEVQDKLIKFKQQKELEVYKQETFVKRQETIERLHQQGRISLKLLNRESKKIEQERKQVFKFEEEKRKGPQTFGELEREIISRKGDIDGPPTFDKLLESYGEKTIEEHEDAGTLDILRASPIPRKQIEYTDMGAINPNGRNIPSNLPPSRRKIDARDLGW